MTELWIAVAGITLSVIALATIAVIYALIDAFILIPALLELYEIGRDAIREIREEEDH